MERDQYLPVQIRCSSAYDHLSNFREDSQHTQVQQNYQCLSSLEELWQHSPERLLHASRVSSQPDQESSNDDSSQNNQSTAANPGSQELPAFTEKISQRAHSSSPKDRAGGIVGEKPPPMHMGDPGQ